MEEFLHRVDSCVAYGFFGSRQEVNGTKDRAGSPGNMEVIYRGACVLPALE